MKEVVNSTGPGNRRMVQTNALIHALAGWAWAAALISCIDSVLANNATDGSFSLLAA